MKIKCISKNRPNQENGYSSIKVGEEYIVLTIEFYDSSSIFSKAIGDFVAYRIKDNDGTVTPYPAKNFEIVASQVPTCWVTYRNASGCYSILPKMWAREYFWDDFYNDEEKAVEDFRRETQGIYSEQV